MVKVNGAERANVAPGERIEIGRKPMRPLPDDGIPRLEVVDGTRSMSKRHAVFSVEANGAALLRDLDSTNGSYVVSPNGDLMRLPAGVDFPLPSTTMRMQFGDVPVDFVRAEHPAVGPSEPVPDLFGYAAAGSHQEPDAAGMSVDDILNLRAGEPTTMFDAAQVQRRAADLNEAESRVYPPAGLGTPQDDDPFAGPQVDSMPINVGASVDPGDSEPRDLFSDALDDSISAEGQWMEENGEASSAADAADAIESTISVNAVFGSSAAAADDGAAEVSEPSEPVEATAPDADEVRDIPAQASDAEDDSPTDATDMTPSDGARTEDPGQDPVSDDGQVDCQRYMPSADETADGAQETYTPAFEPGSVFERVSKGEFQQAEPAVEVEGLTSEEAKRTADFSLQFEMARHPQLLPFLAMNPSLYDDLYAWLAAQGDPDIDQALSRNTGYQEYRQAVGK